MNAPIDPERLLDAIEREERRRQLSDRSRWLRTSPGLNFGLPLGKWLAAWLESRAPQEALGDPVAEAALRAASETSTERRRQMRREYLEAYDALQKAQRPPLASSKGERKPPEER